MWCFARAAALITSQVVVLLQGVMWQVVDATLREVRKGYFAALEDYWIAKQIYEAQLHAKQVCGKLSREHWSK